MSFKVVVCRCHQGLLRLLLAGLPAFTQGQSSLTDKMESASGHEVDITQAYVLCENLQDLEAAPLDLNSASPGRLEATGLFTPYQIRQILVHRERYGSFLSIYELGSLEGFRKDVLPSLAPYIRAGPAGKGRPMVQPVTKVLIRISGNYPKPAGFIAHGTGNGQPAFAGSPLHPILKIHHTSGRALAAGLAFEKEPGETMCFDRKPQSLSGYLVLRGSGILDRIIAGNYRLNHGMGLLHGSGAFIGTGPSAQSALSLSQQSPYAGTSHRKLKRGLLVRFHLQQLDLIAWCSFVKLDLSLQDISLNDPPRDWALHRRETNVYRTRTEIHGRDLGFLGQAGLQACLRAGRLTAGTQWSTDVSGLTRKGRDSLQIHPRPFVHHAGSFHWTWQPGRFLLQGEYAITQGFVSAMFLHSRYRFNDFCTAGLHVHHYPPGFRDLSSSCFASGSHVSNEAGFMVYVESEPAAHLLAGWVAEMYHHPAPGHRSGVPSAQFRFRFNLGSGRQDPFRWQLGISGKTWQETGSIGSQGPPALVRHDLYRFDGRIGIFSHSHLTYTGRAIFSLSGKKAGKCGIAVVQQAGFRKAEWLRIRLQFVVFNIPGWNERICLYEPGMYHQFNFPVYSGSGQKGTVVLGFNLLRRAALETKISALHLRHADHMGSGQNRVEGNTRWEAAAQLRIRF